MPDGTQEIVYCNPFGQAMLKVFRSEQGEWCRYWRYDANGQVVLTAQPSAVAAYDELKSYLVTLHAENGLVQLTDYFASTAGGGAPGRLKSARVRKGESGSEALLWERQYVGQTAASITVYFVSKETRYIGAPGSGETAVTDFAYTWHSGTAVVSQLVTTLPIVPTTQNGSGLANSTTQAFDRYGNRTAFTDERGFVTQWTHNAGLGCVTQSIVDTAGLHLVTDYTPDDEGRITLERGPAHTIDLDGTATDIRRANWTVYRDAAREQRSATGYFRTAVSSDPGTLINPVAITRMDRAGRIVEEIAAERVGAGPLQPTDPLPQTQYCRWSKNLFDNQSRRTAQWVYHHIPASGNGLPGFDYAETSFGYDARGRIVRIVSPVGTINRKVADSRGLPVAAWVGTHDTGATADDPSGGGATGNDMVKVEAREYDRGASGGNGWLTEIVAFSGLAETRVTTRDYDYRGRTVEVRGEHGFRENRTFDNLDRTTATERWNDDGATQLRVSRTETLFDPMGRVYRTMRYSVDPITGALGIGLPEDTWFDKGGNIVKRRNPEGAGFEKMKYDGAGRITNRYAGYNLAAPTYDEAQTVTNDTIFEQTDFTPDEADNVILEVRRERFHNASQTASGLGALGTTTTEPKARVLYLAKYPDPAGRIAASADYGTNHAGDFTREPVVPPRSVLKLVTSYEFNGCGELWRTTDPNGIKTAQTFDNAARLLQTVENQTTGGTAPDQNRTTDYTYTPDGQIATLAARNATTGDQVTRWFYGTTLNDSGVASNLLLRAKVYPDSDDTGPGLGGSDALYDRVEFRYNRLGEMIERKDQNTTVHTYDYDRLGRLLNDGVPVLGTGIDGAVRRISLTYDRASRLESVTSWDVATPRSGSPVNQVLQRYNGFGQLTHEYQSHTGAVDLSLTPIVRYTYADGSARNIRRLSTLYPAGREIALYYGANGSDDWALGRVQEIRDATDANRTLARYTRRGLAATMRIQYLETGVEMTYIKQAGEPNGDGGDQYTGQDRFNRIIDIRWLQSATGNHCDRFQYTFDSAGNRLSRSNLTSGDSKWNEAYTYDNLYQLASRQRGGTIAEEQFTYDSTGNWQRYLTKAAGSTTLDQTRTHNKANEITAIAGSAATVGYDRAGNMTLMPRVGDWAIAQTPTWDAWNRMVKITQGTSVIGTYAYDGMTRRVWKETTEDGSLTRRHFYYSDQWQVIEERLGTATTADRRFVWGMRYIDDLIVRDRALSGGNERLYATHDQWHVTGTINTAGLPTERYAFSAFGDLQVLTPDFTTRPSGSVSDWETTYGAYRFDREARQHAVRFRELHPALGRWVSRDPVVEVVGNNFYLYVSNASTNKSDSTGLIDPGERVGKKVNESCFRWCLKKLGRGAVINHLAIGKCTIFAQMFDPPALNGGKAPEIPWHLVSSTDSTDGNGHKFTVCYYEMTPSYYYDDHPCGLPPDTATLTVQCGDPCPSTPLYYLIHPDPFFSHDPPTFQRGKVDPVYH